VDNLWSAAILALTNAKIARAIYSMETATRNAVRSIFAIMSVKTQSAVLPALHATSNARSNAIILNAQKSVEIHARNALSLVIMNALIQSVQNYVMRFATEPRVNILVH